MTNYAEVHTAVESMKLVTLTDIPALMATLDSIAERWGDFDTSQVVPAPLSHEL